jgi:ketosteroid isomerase-like protein
MQTRSCFSLWSALTMASVLLWAGCVATRHASSAGPAAEEAQVKERLAAIFHAAETKDLARLDSYHWYGPHFTKFGGTGKRMDAAAAREGEHKGLSALTGLKLRAEDLQIDVFGDTAVATFIAAASFQAGADMVTKRERGTLVLVKHSGSWKIVHEHFSAAE